ncbi:MAG: hypothetical protein Q8L48_23470 [Archangium sp.]|nr:hypothetical protein [Archangium sp.]
MTRAVLMRGALAWAVLCAAVYLLQVPVLRALTPAFTAGVELLLPAYRVESLSVEPSWVDLALVTRARPVQSLHAKTTDGFGFTAPILVLALLAAWPFTSSRERLRALAIALGPLLAVMCLDLPLLLSLSVREALQQEEPFVLFLYFNGGRQFVALLIFGLSLSAQRVRPSLRVTASTAILVE